MGYDDVPNQTRLAGMTARKLYWTLEVEGFTEAQILAIIGAYLAAKETER